MCVLFQGICLILKCNEVGGVDPTTFVFIFLIHFIVVQLLSRVQLFVTPWAVARQAPPSPTVSWSLLKFRSIESVMLSNHLILYHPLLKLSSIFSSIRVFSRASSHQVAKLLEFWLHGFKVSQISIFHLTTTKLIYPSVYLEVHLYVYLTF